MPTISARKTCKFALFALLSFFELPSCLSSVSRRLVDEDQLLLFHGTLLNDMGTPISGAQIQFWQTDQFGQYDHPSSTSNTELLDPNFQYFGTATSLDDGSFWFRTQRPGLYTQRPVAHIHFKVWVNGVDVLTSQFYFADENTGFSSLLELELEELVTDDSSSPGSTTFVTNKTIVIASGLDGSFGPLTPSQQAGPFYPVVDFFSFDSDLVTLASPVNNTGTPAPITSPSSPPTVNSNDHSQLPTFLSSDNPSSSSGNPSSFSDIPSSLATTAGSSSSDQSTAFSKKIIATHLIWLALLSFLTCG